jgi:hypothetical protein
VSSAIAVAKPTTTRAETGTPPMSSDPMWSTSAGRPVIVEPSETTKARPVAMLSMPSVTTNDEPSRAFSISRPLARPTVAPVASIAPITSRPLWVDCASLAPTTVASATTAPAERSMAPVRMISSWPVARMATTLEACSRLVTLSVVKK